MNLLLIDQNILLWIQENMRNEVLSPLFSLITSLGNGGLIWVILSVLLLFNPRTRKTGILALISLGVLGLVGNIVIKNLVARPRPYTAVTDLSSVIGPVGGYSFPSGHSGSSFAAAVIFFLMLPKKYGIPALILAALIAFSRLYVGVHYPTDVICGSLLGILIAVLVYKSAVKIAARQKET